MHSLVCCGYLSSRKTSQRCFVFVFLAQRAGAGKSVVRYTVPHDCSVLRVSITTRHLLCFRATNDDGCVAATALKANERKQTNNSDNNVATTLTAISSVRLTTKKKSYSCISKAANLFRGWVRLGTETNEQLFPWY